MKNFAAMTMQEQLEAMLSADAICSNNVYKSNFRPGEEVFVAHFCNETVSNINASIRQTYKFRPKHGTIKEVVFDSTPHPVKYKIIGLISNSFSEELVTKTQEECEQICDRLNQPRV